MSKNCLLIISKNEGMNPISIAKQAVESDFVDKVIISDGSNEETYRHLKEKETNKIEVISERKYVKTGKTGKGIGMINGGIAAFREGYENIAYIDGDICSENIGRWLGFLYPPLDEGIDVVKASFSRSPTDGQITRHITKPLIAMFFPNAWQIDQPIGGELSVKHDVLKDIFSKGLPPPHGWGVDTFITLKSLMFGYTIGEIYLGQKIHRKKTLSNLKKMFMGCFGEAVNLIQYFYSLPIRKNIKPIIQLPSPFENIPNSDKSYMNVKEEVKHSFKILKLLKRLYLPHDELFYSFKEIDDFESFYEQTQKIDINVWVEMLYWFVKKFSMDHMLQYYIRWKIRSLSFCLNEIDSPQQAEDRTVLQARHALSFIEQIGERTHIEKPFEKLYFYRN